MSGGMGPSWRDAAQPGTDEADHRELQRLRCSCGAFLPWQPTEKGEHVMTLICKRCGRTRVLEDPPAWVWDGEPF